MPTPATTMSAWRTMPGRSRVAEWQIVTVQRAISSSSAIGRPTMFDWPMTTACLPTRSSPVSRQQRHAAVRRAGAQRRALQHQAADVVRMKAVDVLQRIDALGDALRVDVLRQRQLHQDAVAPRDRALRRSTSASSSACACRRRAGRARTSACRRPRSSGACCARRPATPGCRRPARRRARAPLRRRRRARRRRRRTSSVSRSARALPSMMRAVIGSGFADARLTRTARSASPCGAHAPPAPGRR